ncbi:MAG: hypothetical protein QM715_09120 [Nibricoccus sp.]
MSQNQTEALKKHLQLCDEVHQLALEENRFLKQHQRTPDAHLLERKRSLLARLDESLAAVKATALENSNSQSSNPTGGASEISKLKSQISSPRPDPERKETIEKARAKILQILHLDRENEQLLLRFSLSARPAAPVAPPAPPPISQIQKIYDRHP